VSATPRAKSLSNAENLLSGKRPARRKRVLSKKAGTSDEEKVLRIARNIRKRPRRLRNSTTIAVKKTSSMFLHLRTGFCKRKRPQEGERANPIAKVAEKHRAAPYRPLATSGICFSYEYQDMPALRSLLPCGYQCLYNRGRPETLAKRRPPGYSANN
jgi:hypothetical protein